MRLRHVIAMSIAALTGLSVVSCSKGPVEAPANVPAAPVVLTTNELGVVELSPNVASHFSLGGGTDCIINPIVLPGNSGGFDIHVHVEKVEHGKTNYLGNASIPWPRGQNGNVVLPVSETLAISFTPKIKLQ
jgi:hypothetical protein